MDQSEILSAFNRHLIDFFNDIERVFPDDLDIKTAKSSLIGIRKMNPKLIIKIWDSHIGLPYKDQIEKGDIDFFINKDYSLDLKDNKNSSLIISKICTLREPIKKLGVMKIYQKLLSIFKI